MRKTEADIESDPLQQCSLEAESLVLEARIKAAIAELDRGGGTVYANGQDVADAACSRYLARFGDPKSD